MYDVNAQIEGIEGIPIMFNRFPPPVKPGDTKKKKPQTLKQKMWIDKNGVYIPTDNIRMLLVGNQFRTGAAKIYGTEYESNKGTKYRDFCKACVWVTGDKRFPKRDGVYFKPKRTTYDDIDVRSFVNAGKSRSTGERPLLLTPWSLSFQVMVTDDSIPEEKIKAFYEVAGLRCGLGNYGPNFGRFLVTKWDPK